MASFAVILLVCRSCPIYMIIQKHLAEQVDGLRWAQVSILRVDEAVPVLLHLPKKLSAFLLSNGAEIVGVKLDLELFKVVVEVLGPQDVCDLHKLVDIVFAQEQVLFPEDLPVRPPPYHRSKDAAQTPDVQAVIIFLEIDKKFRTLERSAGHSNVVFLVRYVELRETPVN